MRGFCISGEKTIMRTAVAENPAPLTNEILASYLTREELAKVLRRDVRTIDRWHARRIGPPRTVIARMVLYSKQSVVKWLASHEGTEPQKRRRK
jgi:hypothetical protein